MRKFSHSKQTTVELSSSDLGELFRISLFCYPKQIKKERKSSCRLKMVVRKMKEKCKDAARMRREKERAEFVELSKLLPLPISTTSQLDKASIIRLTSSYLRMRTAFPKGLGENWGNELRSSARRLHQINMEQQQFTTNKQPAIKELGSLILQTLDGFVFALHKDGKIMYISETASVHLGLPQIDLTGSSVFEYVHPSDHNDIYDILSLSESDKKQLSSSFSGSCQVSETRELSRSFCMRMKCILPKRNAGLVTSGYKAIHCNGYLKVKCNAMQQVASGQQEADWESYALVAVGRSLLPTASTEIRLGTNSFIFRANLDLRLYYIESVINNLLGFEQSEMIGQSLYQFVHVNDISHLEQSHKTLLEKGQVVSKYYRLMRKGGGCIWLQSNASLVNNPRNMPKPQHVICICFVLAENQSEESCLVKETDHITSRNSPDKVVALQSNRLQSRLPLKGQLCKTDRLIGGPIIAKTRNRKTVLPDLRPLVTSHSEVNQISPLATKTIHQEMQHNSAYHCSCMQSKHNFATIGLSRRSSDDTCSMVSSIASTSLSSGSSLNSSQSNNDLSTNYIASDTTYEQQLTYSQYAPTRSNTIDDQQLVSTFYEFVEKPCENQIVWQAPEGGHLEDADDSQVVALNEQTVITTNGRQEQKCDVADQIYFQSVSPNWTPTQVNYSDSIYVNSSNQKQQNYHRLQINTECQFEEKQSSIGAINYSNNQMEANYQESPLYALNSNHYHHVPTYNNYTMSSI